MKPLHILLLASLPACIIHAALPAGAPPIAPKQNLPFGANAVESDERNLLKNAKFEKATTDWELFNWGKNGKMEIDETERHNGKPSLRVENLEACHSFVRQVLTGKPNTCYRLTCYIKTKDVEPAKPGQKAGAVLEVGRIGVYTPLMQGTKGWTKVTVDFTTKGDPIIRVGPSLGSDGPFATGTAWFSELSLIELHGNEQK